MKADTAETDTHSVLQCTLMSVVLSGILNQPSFRATAATHQIQYLFILTTLLINLETGALVDVYHRIEWYRNVCYEAIHGPIGILCMGIPTQNRV